MPPKVQVFACPATPDHAALVQKWLARGPQAGDPCLSVRQPWAWAVAAGVKRFENRSWAVAHRGPLWVHAAAAASDPEAEKVLTEVCRVKPAMIDAARGAVVGVAYLADVFAQKTLPRWAWADILAGGDPFVWWLSAAACLPTPVKKSGKLGLWKF